MKEEVLKESLGIDVSKDSLSLCLGVLKEDLAKEFIPREDVPNDKNGFKDISRWLKQVSSNKRKPTVVMEATGVYHESIALYLHDLGYNVCVMQSGRVKSYAKSLDQRSKTDALDSKMLSMLGCERSLTQWSPPSISLQKLRALSRERSALIRERSIEKNRNHAKLIASYTDKRAVKRYKQRLKLLSDQIAEVELEMREVIEEDKEVKQKLAYMESIPGVSFVSAATVVAETFGFAQIVNAKQLTSYAGYDVVIRESGNFQGKTRISKKGNKHIRAVLHMPSMAAVRVNPTLSPFYNRLKPKKVKPIVALVAVQRKMLVLMYSLWKNNEYYDAEFEQKKAVKAEALTAQDRNKNEFVTS